MERSQRMKERRRKRALSLHSFHSSFHNCSLHGTHFVNGSASRLRFPLNLLSYGLWCSAKHSSAHCLILYVALSAPDLTVKGFGRVFGRVFLNKQTPFTHLLSSLSVSWAVSCCYSWVHAACLLLSLKGSLLLYVMVLFLESYRWSCLILDWLFCVSVGILGC